MTILQKGIQMAERKLTKSRLLDKMHVSGRHYTHEPAVTAQYYDNVGPEVIRGTHTIRPARITNAYGDSVNRLPPVGPVRSKVRSNAPASTQVELYKPPATHTERGVGTAGAIPKNRTAAQHLLDNKAVSWAMNKMGVSGAGRVNPEDLSGGFFNQMKGVGKTLWSGDKWDRAKKIGAVAGLYGAGAVGLRYASGGDLTHNNNGDPDIAGIPFI